MDSGSICCLCCNRACGLPLQIKNEYFVLPEDSGFKLRYQEVDLLDSSKQGILLIARARY